jgi:GT2 family glycosyltransferase
MLTAACLMLSRENYLSVGGLDEGYLVGDFEDSDLCLSLRKLGYRLWLVPEARLWHLERQSVSLSGAATTRQMITLYNGWRYRQKILCGELVDPCAVEVTG